MSNPLLDYSGSFDVGVLDYTVDAFYNGNTAARQKAQEMLTSFQNHPSSWQLVDQILEKSHNLYAKNFVVVRWNTLPLERRLAIRDYIVKIIVNLTSVPAKETQEKTFINKLNVVLVQILKKEWPQHWPLFIPEIIASSKTDLNLCENNMKILKLLSEEIFDFSGDHMTQTKMRKLKHQMIDEFGDVFALCRQVVASQHVTAGLTIATLEALQRILSWIPMRFIFESDLIETLQSKLLQEKKQRNLALKCFTEIIGIEVSPRYHQRLTGLYESVIKIVSQIIPFNSNVSDLYQTADTHDQELVQDLALFLTTFLSKYLGLVENTVNKTMAIDSHNYLLKLSRVPEREILKICFEYWGKMVYEIREQTSRNTTPSHTQASYMLYADILKELNYIIIENIVQPDEVLIITEEQGEIKREFIQQSDTSALYKSMHQVFGSLTSLDVQGAHLSICENLTVLTSASEWAWKKLYKLCWAVGAMSGSMEESKEEQLLTDLTQSLFGLLQTSTHSKDQTYVVISCIFYLAKHYLHFLKTHQDFLRFVMDKIMTYFHDAEVCLQDIACNTFLKICQGCQQELTAIPPDNQVSMVEALILDMQRVTSDLGSNQVCIVYESIGHVLSTAPFEYQTRLISPWMSLPNEAYRTVLQQVQANPTLLQTAATLRTIINVIKINTAACSSVGPSYWGQLDSIFPGLITTYQQQGKSQVLKSLRRVKTEILSLVETVMVASEKLDQDNALFSQLLNVIMKDYEHSVEYVKESGVLDAMTSVLEKMNNHIWPGLLEATIACLFKPTLSMISQNLVDFPDHRHGFYRLVRVLNRQCIHDLLSSSPETFQLFVESILWGTKHTTRDISQVALQTCLDLIHNIGQLEDEDQASAFYEAFYVRILREIINVLVDPDYTNGFNYQSQVLATMLSLVQEGDIYTRLFDPTTVENPLMSNTEFLQLHVQQLLSEAFPLLQKDQIDVLVMGMFEYSEDLFKFQSDLRDFLIDIREVSEEDGNARQVQEKEAELELLQYL
ncbi:CRM1 C terminal-domain-containing protein [Spinellus fusiger]|nr:CRM1 C terminal-domain-containing protein [Spinellus fusiger]